jgi:hypothetical protein
MQTTFRGIKITYQSELKIPRNLHHGKTKIGHSLSIIKSKAMQSSIYVMKTWKETFII